VQRGWLHLHADTEGAMARLVVENGGPVLNEGSVTDFAQPFRRAGADRTGIENGSGLGLSIVAAIVEAHSGQLELHALPGGGLQAIVHLPLTASIDSDAT
jgi:signal transduction histidine kinase